MLGATGLVIPNASAQTMWDTVKVTLPYTVTVGEKTLPPGDYTIKQLDSAAGDSQVLLIYNGNGVKFETSALTIHAVDVNTPEKSSVSLYHIGDNYYIDKVWIQGKNYGYQIPLPKNARERETEAAAAPISVPAQTATSDTASSSTTDTTTTTTTDTSTPPTPPPPTPEPAASVPAAPEPPVATDTQQPTTQQPSTPQPPTPAAASDDNSADRAMTPGDSGSAPSMPATSAGWLAMLLSGGTLSGVGMTLRRRKQ